MHFADSQELSLQEVEDILGKRSGSGQRWWVGGWVGHELLTQAGAMRDLRVSVRSTNSGCRWYLLHTY
jgi:hypothetical protein